MMPGMVLACPACDSRHDVTGHAPGHTVRCGCGASLTLAAPPADDPPVLDDAGRRCPRCAAPLHRRPVEDLELEECAACHGVFVDHAAIELVLADRAAGRARALLAVLPGARRMKPPATSERMYLPCPICKVVMNRRLFAMHTGIIVDVCRMHGTFFDGGELPQILELVATGRALRPPPEADHRDGASRPLGQVQLPRESAPQAQLPVARLHTPRDPDTGAVGALIDLLTDLFDTLDES